MPKLSFLTDDAEFTASLTDRFHPEPALGTVVALRGVARELVYRPKAHYDDPDTYGWESVTTMTRSGIDISVYRRPAITTSLVMAWRLPRGYVMTFVDEPEPGMSGIRELADNVRISGRGSSLPKISFDPPLDLGNQKDPVNRDSVIFFAADPAAGEPDQARFFLERRGGGKARSLRHSDGAVEATATENGVTVSLVAAPRHADGAQADADTVASSLRRQ